MDLRVGKVATQRYRCKSCTKTVTVKPKGVGRARRSQPLMALVGVLYSLGLSHRGIELVLGLFGHSVDHVSSWRDMQRLGKAVRNRLPKGRARVVGVVVDVGGRTLGIELSGAGFDYRAWFQGMSDELGVEVVVTDDSTDYSLGIDEAGLSRQQCLVHMKRTLGRAKGRLGKTMGTRYGGLLEQITEMVRELPTDGAERLLK